MKLLLRALAALSLTAAVLAVPTAAQAAPDGAMLAGLVEQDADGQAVSYPVRPGETVPIVLGVASHSGTAHSAGEIVRIELDKGITLPREFTNCQYWVNGDHSGAVCELSRDLPSGETFALQPFRVTAAAEASADDWTGRVLAIWSSKSFFDYYFESIEAYAKGMSGKDTPPSAGVGGEVTLTPRALPDPEDWHSLAVARLRLVTGESSAPTTAPTTGPTTAPTTGPTTGPTTEPAAAPATTEPPEASGGLPITGAPTAVAAAAGSALLIGGVVSLILVRRRRTRFTV